MEGNKTNIKHGSLLVLGLLIFFLYFTISNIFQTSYTLSQNYLKI